MRTSLAITALALCSIVGFSTPPSLQASAMARFECEECEHMGAQQEQMFCGGACENDQQFCGGGAQYCDGEGWDLWCVCVPEDFPCVDPCNMT